MPSHPVITLIGCGKMGSALLRGWVRSDLAEKIFVIEPNGLPDEFKNEPKIILTTSLPECDAFILAVKPQMMNDICTTLSPAPHILALSIAAGQKISNFEHYFGLAHPVIRAMPNTPAAIGMGITALVANAHVTDPQKELATLLLGATGHLEWIDDEALMDAVTALSGSGPAYVFYLIDILAHAGTKCGLPADLAMRLARQTVIGSAALADNESGVSAETLRKNVTSPGGTTEAALNTLMLDGTLEKLFERALKDATARSRELSH